MFDFPSTPVDGQTFTPAGGPTYVWDGVDMAWRLQPAESGGGGGGGASVTTADLPPTAPPPTNGDMWWETDTGKLYVYFDDGSSQQWVQPIGGAKGDQGATGAPGTPAVKTAQAYNRIINGAMQHSQELGITNTITPSAYIVDQWLALASGIAFSAQKTTATAQQISMVVTTGKSLAAGDYLSFCQPIEGLNLYDFNYGSAAALPSVLRFDVYCAVTGTFGISIRNGAANRSLVLSFTVPTASVWQTITLPIPGDTTGTWAVDNTQGFSISITFACGTTYATAVSGWQAGNFLAPAGITNGAATTNNIFYLRNVGLYLDPDNTGVAPPWQMPNFAAELIRCQRYYETGGVFYQIPAAGTLMVSRPFKQTMRTTPTCAIGTASSSGITSLLVNSVTPTEVNFQATGNIAGAYTSFPYTASARM